MTDNSNTPAAVPVEIIRIYLTDGTQSDARLHDWREVVLALVTNGYIVTDQVFINRESIIKVVRMLVSPEAVASGFDAPNVVALPVNPKGAA